MSAAHSLRELSGKSWHEWPAASSCSTSITPTSSRSHSPKPLNESDACMRLPRKDKHIYGQCPAHDDFVLVVCPTCKALLKIEAFSSHVQTRHQGGSGSGRFNTKACSVDLLKMKEIYKRPSPSTTDSFGWVNLFKIFLLIFLDFLFEFSFGSVWFWSIFTCVELNIQIWSQ